MVEQTTHFRPYDPDIETYDDRDRANQHVTPYTFGRSSRDLSSSDRVPLFISDSDGDPDPQEYISHSRYKRRTSASARILAAVLAAAAVAVLFAAVSADATRDLIVSAKASIAAVLPAPSVAAQPDAAKLTAHDIQLKDPARLAAPANQTIGSPRVVATVAVAPAPSRAEITTAYQSALQSRAPAAMPTGAMPTATPPARQIDADTLAAMMKRARGLIEAGDIPAARLLLERAADAQEVGAALLLAQTYDPAVLGTPDMRSITPDPAAARGWYEKAARLGSADAQARLSQMQN